MNCHDDSEFVALDAYIRAQLLASAETYASHADIDAKLKAVLEAGRRSPDGDTTAAES